MLGRRPQVSAEGGSIASGGDTNIGGDVYLGPSPAEVEAIIRGPSTLQI